MATLSGIKTVPEIGIRTKRQREKWEWGSSKEMGTEETGGESLNKEIALRPAGLGSTIVL